MIAVLSLLVAILAVFFGPLVAWIVAQRQITVVAREAWLREFREKVAAFLYAYDRFVIYVTSGAHSTGDEEKEAKLAQLNDDQRLPYHVIRLLIGERGNYAQFISSMDSLLQAPVPEVSARRDTLFDSANQILRSERVSIEESPGIWADLLVALGLRQR